MWGLVGGWRLSGWFGLRRLAAQREANPARLGIMGLETPDVVWEVGPGRSVSQAHRKLLFDRFCQQAAQGSWIDDVEAEQGGADEFHGVAVSLHHEIGDALEGWMAKQDRAGVCIHRLAHAPQLIRQGQRFVGRLDTP